MTKTLTERMENSQGRMAKVILKRQYKFMEKDGRMTVIESEGGEQYLDSMRWAVGEVRNTNDESFEIRYTLNDDGCKIPYETVSSFRILRP